MVHGVGGDDLLDGDFLASVTSLGCSLGLTEFVFCCFEISAGVRMRGLYFHYINIIFSYLNTLIKINFL